MGMGMDNGFYLYALAKSDAPIIDSRHALLSQMGLDDQHPIERIESGGICAFASRVVIPEFETELKEKIKDIVWLERTARRHDDIVRFLSSRWSVVPVRFGTIMKSAEGLMSFLDQNREQLHDLLDELDGCCEMGATIWFDKKLITKAMQARDRDLQELAAKTETAARGARYLMNKKFQLLEEEKFNSMVEQFCQAIKESTQRTTRKFLCRPLQPDRANSTLLKISIASLVPIALQDEFRHRLNRMAEAKSVEGITVQVTGPWPTYSFSHFAQTLEAAERGSKAYVN
ncbi:MAG TPA: GvpL/GvpF family gas vesicle protein [Oculatellaceae cyanobacterium]